MPLSGLAMPFGPPGIAITHGCFFARASAMPCPIAHTPLPSSETSTTEPSPVRSRLTSAAAMPPARFVPEIVSPYAGTGSGRMPSRASGEMLAAADERAQNAVMS